MLSKRLLKLQKQLTKLFLIKLQAFLDEIILAGDFSFRFNANR